MIAELRELITGERGPERVDRVLATVVFTDIVASTERAGEVLVSRTVTDLVTGSGARFEDRGLFDLKGLPERWQLFRLIEA